MSPSMLDLIRQYNQAPRYPSIEYIVKSGAGLLVKPANSDAPIILSRASLAPSRTPETSSEVTI